MAKIVILGTGGFGTSLAVMCQRFGHDVTLWGEIPGRNRGDPPERGKQKAAARRPGRAFY